MDLPAKTKLGNLKGAEVGKCQAAGGIDSTQGDCARLLGLSQAETLSRWRSASEDSTSTACPHFSRLPSKTSSDGSDFEPPFRGFECGHECGPRETYPARTIRLTKEEAVALQVELLEVFSSAAFQKELNELRRTHKNKTSEYTEAFTKLVRRTEFSVIPKYGLEASEEGVQDLLLAFHELRDDHELFINAAAIKEALEPAEAEATPHRKNSFAGHDQKPRGKLDIVGMLEEYTIAYSKPGVVADVERLKRTEQGQGHRSSGFYHLPGRSGLAFQVHKKLLPHWGFEASQQGVLEMLMCTARFLEDPEVARLFDTVNAKLGMTPPACRRFREKVCQAS